LLIMLHTCSNGIDEMLYTMRHSSATDAVICPSCNPAHAKLSLP